MIKIAWRNLWRNRTRTLITATAIALAYALYLMANGIQDWTFDEMRRAAAKAAGGDVLVQTPSYAASPSNRDLLRNADELLNSVRAVPGVEHAAPRILIEGLLTTSSSSNPVVLRAIEPGSEKQINDMSRYLVDGAWFTGDDEAPVVLGQSLAEELQVTIGDRVILTATDASNEMSRTLFYVSGIVSTGSALADRSLAFTALAEGQRALRAPNAFTEIGVVGELPRHQLADQLRAAMPADVAVMPWDVAMPDLVGFIEMKKGGGAFFGALLFLVVLFSIMNTFLMIVMERVREFGLLGALGLSPAMSAGILLFETAMLALVAMGIGLALALAAHTAIATYGIDFTALYGDSMDVAGVTLADTTIYSRINPVRWFQSSVAVFFMVLIAAVYPAFKASRLRPTEAMRFFE